MTERDDELHDARVSALYHRRDNEQPSGRLDAVIRKAARRAGAGRSTAPSSATSPRRLWPSLASAAVLVLAAAVALKVFERPQPLSPPSGSAPPKPESIEPESSAPPAAEEARPERPAAAPSPVLRREAPKSTAADEADRRRAESAAPPGVEPADESAPVKRGGRLPELDGVQDRVPVGACADLEALRELETVDLRQRLETARRADDQSEADCLRELLRRRSERTDQDEKHRPGR